VNDSLAIIPVFIVIIYLLFRTLVPWLREQATIAKAIVDNKQDAPDLDKAVSDLMDAVKKDKEDE
jgi:hypothetical protein